MLVLVIFLWAVFVVSLLSALFFAGKATIYTDKRGTYDENSNFIEIKSDPSILPFLFFVVSILSGIGACISLSML